MAKKRRKKSKNDDTVNKIVLATLTISLLEKITDLIKAIIELLN